MSSSSDSWIRNVLRVKRLERSSTHTRGDDDGQFGMLRGSDDGRRKHPVSVKK